MEKESLVTQEKLSPIEMIVKAAVEKVYTEAWDVMKFIHFEVDELVSEKEKLRVLYEKRDLIEKNMLTLRGFDIIDESTSPTIQKLVSLNQAILNWIEKAINRTSIENTLILPEGKGLTIKQQILLADHLGMLDTKQMTELNATRKATVITALLNRNNQKVRENFERNGIGATAVRKKEVYTIDNIIAVNKVLKEAEVGEISEKLAN